MKHKRLFSVLLAAGMTFGAAFAFAACDWGDANKGQGGAGVGTSQGGGNGSGLFDHIFGSGNQDDIDLTPTEGLIYEKWELEEDVVEEGFTLAAGTYYVICGIEDTTVTSIVVPDIYNGYPVVMMGGFEECTQIQSVVIGSNIRYIPVLSGHEVVFSECGNLKSITVARENPRYHSAGNCIIETESKTLIRGCKASVIPTDGSVTGIGECAFYKCSGLTSITIPKGVTSIERRAFEGCSGLTNITISDSVTNIEYLAFRDCSGLTRIDYQGTKDQWNAIEKEYGRNVWDVWDQNTGDYTVYCTDGTIQKSEA